MGKSLCVGILAVLLVHVVQGYLYNDLAGKHMHLLDGDTVDEALLNVSSGHIWMMQFFSHWCGSCQNFVPKWVRIVEAVQNWSPIVKSAALDCAENTKVCRKYRVNGYPCVRLYWPSVSGQTYHDFGNMLPFTYQEITLRVAKAIIALATNTTYRQSLPPVTKYLLPTKLGVESSWKFLPSAQEKLLILETEADVATFGAVGPLVCLNTSFLHTAGRLHVKYSILTKTEEANTQDFLFSKLRFRTRDPLQFPALLQLDPTNERVSRILRMGREAVFRYFDSFADLKTEVFAATTTLPTIYTHAPEGSETSVWLPEDDLYGAVYHFINHEVTLHENITPGQMEDLGDFLSAIIQYVPFPTTAIEESLRSIFMAITGNNSPSQMPISRWLDIVKEADMPQPRPWKHCRGSKPHFRGYPCSLWLLFHTITTNAARQPDSFELTTAFPAIRGFVRSFFGCRECAGHFWNATTKYANTPNSEAHVLLWKIHNRVNNRLAGAVSEDPESPKIQFPSEKLCPLCYKDNVTEAQQDHWNKKTVAAFLRRYYSPDSIVSLSELDTNAVYTPRRIGDYLFKTD